MAAALLRYTCVCLWAVLGVLSLRGYGQALPTLNIQSKDILVAGVSSGGAMAVQMHVAYSKTFKGAGIYAGPPYWCAMNNVAIALESCMQHPELILLDSLWAAAEYAYATLTIDSPTELQNSKVWLFSGTNDTVVSPGVVRKTAQFYEAYAGASNVQFLDHVPAEHAWVTDNWGNHCAHFGSPYMNDCKLDAVRSMLTFLSSDYSANAPVPTNSSNLFTFTQEMYTPLSVLPAALSMDTTGYYYSPPNCQAGRPCKLLVALHGCGMGHQSIGLDFVLHSGLNEWAEANDIVVLYPQVIAANLPYNPEGCWDWWGYTGVDYATQYGPQMLSIWNMMKQLIGVSKLESSRNP